MLREKATRVILLDRMHRYSPQLEPPAKMFDRLNVSMNRITRVPAVVQITHESVENYGEMAGCHPATRKRSLEVTFDHGNRSRRQRLLNTLPFFLLVFSQPNKSQICQP